ncbi:MAG TPA: hypothetical protein VE954_15810 [Oligoflexus sp.]|uniref:hypothetical protein n=1 Tax=Oligoflexus sp. TaxID=1971216 RepID=UPI002D39EAC0|nr:hypothetical protein [Oligoflexus sp.]HYX34565.1 hypothetical protein [Oligoflexus sp.]
MKYDIWDSLKYVLAGITRRDRRLLMFILAIFLSFIAITIGAGIAFDRPIHWANVREHIFILALVSVWLLLLQSLTTVGELRKKYKD